MKKLFIVFLSVIISFSVFGKWESYGKKNGIDRFYDTDNMTYDADLDTWKIWFLLDFGKVENVQNKIYYQSMVQQIEVNCISRSYRQAYVAFLADPMGKGEIVYKLDKPKEWVPIIPNREDDIYSLSYQSMCIDSKKKDK